MSNQYSLWGKFDEVLKKPKNQASGPAFNGNINLVEEQETECGTQYAQISAIEFKDDSYQKRLRLQNLYIWTEI